MLSRIKGNFHRKIMFSLLDLRLIQCWIGEREHGCQCVQHLGHHGQSLQVGDVLSPLHLTINLLCLTSVFMDWVELVCNF